MKKKIFIPTLLVVFGLLMVFLAGCKKHEHLYSSTWDNDNETHYHECECGDKSNVANHTFELVITSQPTFESKGTRVNKCSVCGYEKDVEEIPVKNHNYKTTWSFDDNDHYHECTDEGYTNLVKDEEAHTLDIEKNLVEATYDNPGSKTLECSVCGYEKEVVIPKLEKQDPVILTNPSASNIYNGQPLLDSILTLGEADVEGVFNWKDENFVTDSAGEKSYLVVFTPTNQVDYNKIEFLVEVNVIPLYVYVYHGSDGKVVDSNGNAILERLSVTYGSDVKVSIIPNEGKALSAIKVGEVSKKLSPDFYFENIKVSQVLNVTFEDAEENYNVIIQSNGTGLGSLSNEMAIGENSFDYMASCAFTLTTATGYKIKTLTIGSCNIKEAVGKRTFDFNFSNVISDISIEVSYDKDPQIIVNFVDMEGGLVASHGTVKIMGSDGIDAHLSFVVNGEIALKITADEGYYIKKIYTDQGGELVFFTDNPTNDMDFSKNILVRNIDSDVNVYVVFEKCFTVTISIVGEGVASKDPDGLNLLAESFKVRGDGDLLFFAVASDGYIVKSIKENEFLDNIYPENIETYTEILLAVITEDIQYVLTFIETP